MDNYPLFEIDKRWRLSKAARAAFKRAEEAQRKLVDDLRLANTTRNSLFEENKKLMRDRDDYKARWQAEGAARQKLKENYDHQRRELRDARDAEERHRMNWVRAMGYIDRIREENTRTYNGPRTGDDARGGW